MPAWNPSFSQSERLPLTINVRSVFFRKTGKATPGSKPRACFCELCSAKTAQNRDFAEYDSDPNLSFIRRKPSAQPRKCRSGAFGLERQRLVICKIGAHDLDTPLEKAARWIVCDIGRNFVRSVLLCFGQTYSVERQANETIPNEEIDAYGKKKLGRLGCVLDFCFLR
jgi:hypothetical protein